MNARALLLLSAIAPWVLVLEARADGFVPAKPYNYLHPPPALARLNHSPYSGTRSVPLRRGRSTSGFAFFTKDTQAGLGAHPGAFSAPSPARTITLSIAPVNLPASLPDHLLLDGNAYRFSATGEPGRRPVRVHQLLGIVLVWPRMPFAVYVYTNRRWHRVCNARTWQLSANLVICHPSTLGVFAAVHRSLAAAKHSTGKQP